MNTHNKTYYAEGSVFVMDNDRQIKKDSFKLYSPDGKKLNINIDLNGDKLYVRNAKIDDMVQTKPINMTRIMPKRSLNNSLLEDLEKLTTESDKPAPKKKSTRTKTLKKNKKKSNTPKRSIAPTINRAIKSKSSSKSQKRSKTSQKTARKRNNTPLRKSLLSNTLL